MSREPSWLDLVDPAFAMLDARRRGWRKAAPDERAILVAGAVWWCWRARRQAWTENECARAVAAALICVGYERESVNEAVWKEAGIGAIDDGPGELVRGAP